MASKSDAAGPAAMVEDNLIAHQQNDPRFIPGCGYGSEAYKLRERILAPRRKKDDDPLVVYIGGPCGAGKSSLVKTIRYLLDNDFDADWKAVPRVPPFTRGCGAAQGSVTRGIDHYDVHDQSGETKFVLMDMDGLEGYSTAERQAMARLAEGRLQPGTPVEWQGSALSRMATRVCDFFRTPKRRGPDVFIVLVNLALNYDFAFYRRIFEDCRKREQIPFAVVVGMEAYQATTPRRRATRCPGHGRKHVRCINDANPCYERLLNRELGIDTYFVEPCREGEGYGELDFLHFGESNILEMLKLLRDALEDAERHRARSK